MDMVVFIKRGYDSIQKPIFSASLIVFFCKVSVRVIEGILIR